MIFPRIILLGNVAAAAKWVGVAKRLARETHSMRILNKVWDFGAVRIRVENYDANLSKVFIEAAGGTGYYQFYGSEGYLLKTFEDPDIPGRWLPIGNWVGVTAKLKGNVVSFVARPLLSSIRTSDDDVWPYLANPYYPDDYLPVKPVHQPDGAGVKVAYNTENELSQWLVSTWAEPTPYYAAYMEGAGSPNLLRVTDKGFDVAPTVFSGKQGSVQVPETDWYRGACISSATDPQYGTRRFIIMVDITHTFYCYPIGVSGENIGESYGDKANVESKYVESQAAPLPAWVTTFDVGKNSGLSVEDHSKAIQPQWVFSPNGDKAAVIAFNRDDPWEDDFFTSSMYSGGVKLQDMKEDWPGLIEVKFTIALTGPDPEDFSFSVDLKQESYSKETGRGFLAVGYCSQDFDNLPGLPRYNDLVVLEHDYYMGDMFRPASDYDYPAGGYTVQDPDGHVLQHPPVAAVARVYAEDRLVLSWLSAYTALWGRYDGFTAKSRFDPEFADLTDKPGQAARQQFFSFQTHIHGMDLSTFAFCLASTATLTGLCTSGSTFYGGFFMQWSGPFCASAVLFTVYRHGEVDYQAVCGHPQLYAVLDKYLDLSHTTPDLTSMTQINLKATIDSEAFYPETDSDIFTDLIHTLRYRIWPFYESVFDNLSKLNFANITLNPGLDSGTPLTKTVLHTLDFGDWYQPATLLWMSEPNWYYTPLHTCPLFDTKAFVLMVPRVFTLFDDDWYVRPGIRWVQSETSPDPPFSGNYYYKGYAGDIEVETGESSFTGYPVGAIIHSRYAAAALNALNNPYTSLASHPNGSYATEVGPFMVFPGTVATHPNISERAAKFTPALLSSLQQFVFDRISVRMVYKNGYVEGHTDHLTQMKRAFDLDSLTQADYLYLTGIFDDKFIVQPKVKTPDLVPSWFVTHSNEYDNQYNGVLFGGAPILAPMCVGWVKHVYISSSGGTRFLVTLPTFNESSLATCPTSAYLSSPTTRMEGIFYGLPMVKKAP